MKFGTEDKKKVWVLAALGVVAAYFVYSNVFSDSSGPTTAPKSALVTERERIAAEASGAAPAAVPGPGAAMPQSAPARRLGGASRSRGDEFHPSLRPKNKEDQIVLSEVDPTLHLELLARVQNVKLDGGQRNLFQFGESVRLAGDEPKIVPKREAMGPPVPPPPAPPPGPAAVVPPPPMTMKYYGLATKRIDGKKTGFFLDGEEIIFATEGMVMKKRYKVVRINAESVVLENVEFKGQQQTVKIAEDAGGTL
jgi:hypothetical protein